MYKGTATPVESKTFGGETFALIPIFNTYYNYDYGYDFLMMQTIIAIHKFIQMY